MEKCRIVWTVAPGRAAVHLALKRQGLPALEDEERTDGRGGVAAAQQRGPDKVPAAAQGDGVPEQAVGRARPAGEVVGDVKPWQQAVQAREQDIGGHDQMTRNSPGWRARLWISRAMSP